MKFLVTAKGFFKEIIKEKTHDEAGKFIGFKREIFYTDKLREAHVFSTKGKATEFAKRNEIEGWAWSPKEEEPIKNKYEVVRRNGYSSFRVGEQQDHNVLEWYVREVFMDANSDIRFLQTGNAENPNYLSKEDADRLCLQKNLDALNELKRKIKQSIIISRANKVLETVDVPVE